MFCHNIHLSSLLPNPARSRNGNIFLLLLVRTTPYVKLPVRVELGVMMDHSLMKRLAVWHQHATIHNNSD